MGTNHSVQSNYELSFSVLQQIGNGNRLGVYYINLDDRVDRRQQMENEFQVHGFIGTRVPGIRHEQGVIGCGFSHIAALQQGIASGADHILIFEDDFMFSQVPEVVHHVLQTVQNTNYDVFLLGYCLFHKKSERLFPTSHPMFLKIRQAGCAHGYMVRKGYAQTLLKNMKEGIELRIKTNDIEYNVDNHWKLLQDQDLWLCYSKGPIGVQREGFSDIEGEVKWDNNFLTKSLGFEE